MRTSRTLAALIPLLLVACDATPVAPGLELSPLFAADSDDDDFVGPIASSLDLTAPPTDPGQVEVVDGILRVRGQRNEGTLSGDFTGTALIVVDIDVDQASGLGTGGGTFHFDITSVRGEAVTGSFSGTFEGDVAGPTFRNSFRGSGDGDLEELLLVGTSDDAATDNLFVLAAAIVEADDDDDDDDDDDEDEDDDEGDEDDDGEGDDASDG